MLGISKCLDNLGIPVQTNFSTFSTFSTWFGHPGPGRVLWLCWGHTDQMAQGGTCSVWLIPPWCTGFAVQGRFPLQLLGGLG